MPAAPGLTLRTRLRGAGLCGKIRFSMKKLLPAALFLSALALITGCEQHDYASTAQFNQSMKLPAHDSHASHGAEKKAGEHKDAAAPHAEAPKPH